MLLADAKDVRVGISAASAAYVGSSVVWSALDPDTRAYLAATGLDPDYAPVLDNLIVGLKDFNLRQKMSAAYAFIGGTPYLHQWNLWDARDLDAAYRLTYVNGSRSTHSTALGYRPNPQGDVANGAYADTHLVPLDILAQDSTHLGYYSLLELPPISRCEIGCYSWAGSGARFHIIARYQPSEFYYGQCENGAANCNVPASTGLFVATRTGPTAQTAYRNGVQVGSSTASPASGLPPTTVWVGAINSFVDCTDLPCGFASIGSGLSAQNVADLYSVVQAFQTSLGRAA